MATRLTALTVTAGLAAALLTGCASTLSPTGQPLTAVTDRPPVPRTSGESSVLVEITASRPEVLVSLQVLGVNAGVIGSQAELIDQPVPVHQQLRFHRGPGAGTLGVAVRNSGGGYSGDFTISCTITIDGQMVLRDPSTTRCTYSEDPRWQYLLEKGIP